MQANRESETEAEALGRMDGNSNKWMDGHTEGPRTDSHPEIAPFPTGFVPIRATAQKERSPALFSGSDKKLILYCVLRLV